jgi:hypothetical protein
LAAGYKINIMRKYIKALLIALTVIILTPAVAVLAGYNSSISVRNTGATSYGMLACNVSANVAYWESDGFIGENGTDVRIYRGAVEIPHMMVTDRITFALPVLAYSSQTLQITTGETPLSDFYIIPGYSNNSSVGYVKTPDAPAIELGDNFSLSWSNIYLNTDNGTDKNIIRKDDAFYLFTSNTTSGDVTATIPEYNGTETLLVNGNGSLQQFDVLIGAATHWQAVLTIDDDTSYIGNTAFARKEDLFTVTDTALNTGAVIDSVTVTMRIINASTGRTALKTHGTTYYGGSKNPGGAWTTYTQVYATNPNTGLAWTLDEINDMEIGVNMESVGVQVNCTYVAATIGYHYNAVSTTLTGISSGEYDVTVSADTTHLILDIDGTTNSTALNGASVPDNANDIYLFENNSAAYCGDMELEIDGVQQLYYNPNDIIVSTGTTGTLPDRVGANDGTIYWGGNPANIALTVGAFESDYAVDTEIAIRPVEIVPEVSIDTLTTADAAKIAGLSVKDPALYPLISAINTAVGIPIMFMYQGVFFALAVGLLFLFGKFGHLTIGVVASLVIIGFATAWGVYDVVMLVILIICGLGLILTQGRQTV